MECYSRRFDLKVETVFFLCSEDLRIEEEQNFFRSLKKKVDTKKANTDLGTFSG